MIGAVAGFALVFAVTVVTVSALGAIALRAARRWLQGLGVLAERRAAEAVAIMPVVIGGIVIVVLVAQSLLGADHCQAHGHHAHLCFTHGAQWIERTWVVVVLAVACAMFVARAAIVAATYARGARSVRLLQRFSRLHGHLWIVDSDRAFCFVTRRGVFVSSRVWSDLPEEERDALVAHEQAHLRNGDLAKRLVLELFLLLAAPCAGEIVRDTWLRASERLCDAHAASIVGDPETVARAMVSMCRLGAQPTPGFAFTPLAAELAARIRAVLAEAPLGERAAAMLMRAGIVACVVVASVGIAAAGPVHHAFETLLG